MSGEKFERVKIVPLNLFCDRSTVVSNGYDPSNEIEPETYVLRITMLVTFFKTTEKLMVPQQFEV